MTDVMRRRGRGERPRRRARTAAVAAASASCALLLVLAGCGGSSDDGSGTAKKARPPAGKADDSEGGPDRGDFNGDGYDDYVTPVHSASEDRKRTKDTLLVVYGSEKGLNPSWTRRLDGRFGSSLLRTDLDSDGFTDLVAARTHDDKVQPYVLFGGPRGLGKARKVEAPRNFGPMAVGDFDGDGRADLFDPGGGGKGDPSRNPDGPRGDVPARILYGPFGGDGAPSGKSPREPVTVDVGQHGYSSPNGAVAGDFDADGRTDLFLTYGYDAEQDDGAPDDLTPLAHYRGAEHGLTRDRDTEQKVLKAMGGRHDGLSVGDVDADGTDDLLLPLRRSASDTEPREGKGGGVGVLHGARSGLGAGKPARRIFAGRNESFGASPAVGEVNGDDHPDLVVNTPDFRGNDGLVTLLPGGADGPSAEGSQEVHARTEGLPGAPNRAPWNLFNFQPPLLDTDGDGHDEAVVLAPLFNKRKGAILQIAGSDKGFAPTRSRQFTPSAAGVPLLLK
ncbi:FG-GAP and VCBS repeat-containing protein [Streptomyces sp. NPDC006990]|uniref:FG-GAP and VCBS repeat-containing protein n=1 Tax=unclassified Streptomyces TaxID=2593676 RepID=UPI003452FAAF